MDPFVIDTIGKNPETEQTILNIETGPKSKFVNIRNNLNDAESDTEDDDGDYGGLPPPSKNISHIINRGLRALESPKKPMSKFQSSINEYVEAMGWNNKSSRGQSQYSNISSDLTKTDVEAEIAKSNINGLERIHQFNKPSDNQLKKIRKAERSTNKGPEWFNMPATEVTEEIENDLKILQMRSALNPKHFYKKNDLRVLPKYFQVGTVQHSPIDYYQERHIRKNKSKSMVDELMADAEIKQFTKRKYKEIMVKKQEKGYDKAFKKMKKLKKKK